MSFAHSLAFSHMVRCLLGVVLLFSALFASASPVAAQVPVWSDSQTEGDITYLLRKSPAQIMRYDLENANWLAPIALDAIPSAFVVDPPHIFVAYGRVVERIDLDGTNAIHVTNTPDDVIQLLVDGELLFISQSGSSNARFTSVNKTTFAVLDEMGDYADQLSGASIARSMNKLFGARTNTSPRDITWATYSDEGIFLSDGDSPYHGDYPAAYQTWVSPDETKVLDDSGTIYNASDLTYNNSFGVDQVVDLAFHGTDIPVVLTGGELVSFSNTFLETGRYSLEKLAQNFVIHDNRVFAFQEDPELPGEVAVEIVALDALQPDEPDQPISPVGLDYVVNDSALDADGILYLLSKSHNSVFRWGLESQEYLTTIALPEAGERIVYAQDLNRLYIYAPSQKLYRIDLGGDTVVVEHHATVPLPIDTLIPLGEELFVAKDGSWNEQWIYGADGSLIASNVFCCYDEFRFYDEETRRLYHDSYWRPYLGNGEFGEESGTYLSGFDPLALSPDGQMMVDAGGKVYTAADLEQIDVLSNNILAAAWNSEATFFTVKDNADEDSTVLQKWSSGYTLHSEQRLAGSFLRMYSNGKNLVVITSDQGRPVVTTLTPHLQIIPPANLAAPSPEVSWFSATAATLIWDGVFGAAEYVIERRVSTEGEWSESAVIPGDKATYTDFTLAPGVVYEYRVHARNGIIVSDYSGIVTVDLRDVVDDRVDPRTVTFTPDDAIISDDDKIYLLSGEHESIFVWDAVTQDWAKTIPLRGAPESFTYSAENGAIYTLYNGEFVQSIDLSKENPIEIEFLQIGSSYRQTLIAAGEFLIVSDNADSWEPYVSLDAEGNLIDRFRLSYYMGGAVWSPVNRQIYYLRDGTSPNDLMKTGIGADGLIGATDDSPYHSSSGILHPVRVDPQGTIVILGSGRIYDAATLEQIDTLAFNIDDAVWLDGQLITLADDVIHSYPAENYDATEEVSLVHPGLRLFSTSDGNLVALSQSAEGRVMFDLFSPAFDVVAPETLAQPTDLTARIPGPDRITLSWADVAGENGYRIERRPTGSETWEEVGLVGYNVTGFEDSGVVAGQTYVYQVSAFNGSLVSSPSSEFTVRFAAPEAPTDFSAFALDGFSIQLDWEASSGASTYKLVRTRSDEPTLPVVYELEGVDFFIDTNLDPATTYEYRLEAINGFGASDSQSVTATTELVPPERPYLSILHATPYEVVLAWSMDEFSEETVIERSVSEELEWEEVAVVAAPGDAYRDTTVEPETTYSYRIYSRNAAGDSLPSFPETVTVPQLDPPAQPVPDAIYPESGTSLLLSWHPVALAEGYRLFYRTSELGEWIPLAELGADETRYLQTGLIEGDVYEYRLIAWNETGESTEALFTGSPREYFTLLADDFSDGISRRLWHDIQGGYALNGGVGFHTGEALWFNGFGAAQTMAVAMSRPGYLRFSLRAGDQPGEENFTYWRRAEGPTILRLQYSTDGSDWWNLEDWPLDHPYFMEWRDVLLELPPEAGFAQTRFRWVVSGDPGSWAIDNVEILGRPPGPVPVVDYVQPFVLNSSTVRLSWQEPSTTVFRSHVDSEDTYLFQVERRVAGGEWEVLALLDGAPLLSWMDYAAPSGTTLFYRIRTLSAWGESLPSIHGTVTTLSQLDEWRLIQFGVTENTDDYALTAKDSYGVTNLEHYAFGTELGEPAETYPSGQRGMPRVDMYSSQKLLIVFPRRNPATNPEIEYIVEFSDDLSTWVRQAEPRFVRTLRGNWQEVSYEQPSSFAGTPRCFVRVRIVPD